MRKLLVSICAGIIGISTLVSPAGAQDLPERQMAEVVSEQPAVPEDGQNSSLSSGSSADSELLIGGIVVAGVLGAAAAGGAWAVQQGLIPNPLPGIIPGPAPAQQTPTPAPVVQPTPVLYNCEASGVIRPELVRIACGNGWNTIEQITWHSWDNNGASGRGLYQANTCRPSCSAGNYDKKWVNFTLGGVANLDGQPGFTRAHFDGRDYYIGPWEFSPERAG